MRIKPSVEIKRSGWMTRKWSLAFNNDDGEKKYLQELFT